MVHYFNSEHIDRSLIKPSAFYYNDPKKALEQFVENNQVEYTISCTKQSTNITEFFCTLEIIGLRNPFVAHGSGKKKGIAENDAFLEACFKLEQIGILESTDAGYSYSHRRKRILEYMKDEDENFVDLTLGFKS